MCRECGEVGHLQRDCLHKNTEKDGPDPTDPGEIVGYAFTNVNTKKPITDKGWTEMMKQMNKLEQSNQVYRAGYKKARAALGKSATETNIITVPNIHPMVTVGATPVPVPTVITPATAPVIEPQAPIIMMPQVTQGRIITIPRGMTRGMFNVLTPTGQNTPATTPQAPWVAMANQGKRLFTPRIVVKTEPTMVSTAVLNKASLPSKKPCGRPHKNASNLPGIGS